MTNSVLSDSVGVSSAIVPAIELVALEKHYGPTIALTGIDLTIEPTEFVVLLGPSGCGKSTILKLIAGLEHASAGEIYINGRLANYLRPKERDVSMVFQNYALYPHMSVATNIGFPLKMRKVAKVDIERQVRDVAGLLELTPYLSRYPDQLSGGQRQRVALGRAIIRDPVAFLMDEPLSNLDALLRVQMRTELLKLHRRVDKTTIYVTHDQVEAMTMGDRIVVLRHGVVQQVGRTHDVYSKPANTFVASFVGSPQMNQFPGMSRFIDGRPTFVGPFRVDLSRRWPDLPPESPMTLGIRPEAVELMDPDDSEAIAGVVDLIEDVGPDDYVSVTVGDVTCVARTRSGERPTEGRRVGIRVPPTAVHLFDASGTRIPDVAASRSA